MPEIRLGMVTPGGLSASAESTHKASVHRDAADQHIAKARKSVAMAKHPSASGSRRDQFSAAASDHLGKAQGHVDQSKHHTAQARRQLNAQYGGTMMGRSANFESGRANAGNN